MKNRLCLAERTGPDVFWPKKELSNSPKKDPKTSQKASNLKSNNPKDIPKTWEKKHQMFKSHIQKIPKIQNDQHPKAVAKSPWDPLANCSTCRRQAWSDPEGEFTMGVLRVNYLDIYIYIQIYIYIYMAGWWFESQLGWWHSLYMEK